MAPPIPIPVIVLNWNGFNDTKTCIEHLLAQTYKNLEIYLADNGSNDEDVSKLIALQAKKDKIKLRLFDENLGFTKAHNIILQEIIETPKPPPYVLLINNDAFADRDWAENLIRVAEEKDWDMVSSKMINFFNPTVLDNVGHRFLNTGEIIPEGSGEVVGEYTIPRINIGACAGSALYRVEMLKAIGLFDGAIVHCSRNWHSLIAVTEPTEILNRGIKSRFQYFKHLY